MGNGLAGQRVVVVGGSSGMGLAVSERLLGMHCEVLIVADPAASSRRRGSSCERLARRACTRRM